MLFALMTVFVAAEEGESGTRLLLPETPELIGGIIAFGLVFFFIWKVAWPAINRTLENRQQAIAGSLREADTAKAEAESLLEDYRRQLADAREESSRIIEDARQTAESMRQDMVARAQSEADQLVARARAEVAAERERALQEVRSEVGALSMDLAEKVVQGSLDREAQRSLIDRYLADLERM